MEIYNIEMQERICRCGCEKKFKVSTQSKQRYFSRHHEWIDQTVVKKNKKYSKYVSMTSISVFCGKNLGDFKKRGHDVYID